MLTFSNQIVNIIVRQTKPAVKQPKKPEQKNISNTYKKRSTEGRKVTKLTLKKYFNKYIPTLVTFINAMNSFFNDIFERITYKIFLMNMSHYNKRSTIAKNAVSKRIKTVTKYTS